MARFYETDEAAAFIASGPSRETSRAVMEAIAFFACDLDEAERIWNGDMDGVTSELAIWERATSNGTQDVDLFWGVEGNSWADEFRSSASAGSN